MVYESRHGFTQRCLDHLAAEVSNLDLWPVTHLKGVPDWHAYDAVVFGGPVYFGAWAPRVVRLVGRHADALARHPAVAAFVVSLSPKAAALQYFGAALPSPLKGKLGHVACFGGGIQWKALAWWERWIVRQVRGIETDASNFDLPAIHALAAWLSAKAPQQ